MNRRSFVSTLAKAAAGFTILPAATTYARAWRPVSGLIVPYWYQTECQTRIYDPDYRTAFRALMTETLDILQRAVSPRNTQ